VKRDKVSTTGSGSEHADGRCTLHYLFKRDDDKLEADILPAITLDLSIETDFFNKGYAALNQKEYSSAIEYFTTLLRINKDHQEALINRGTCYYHIQQLEPMRKDYLRANELGQPKGIQFAKKLRLM